jgi:hypothetical protein
MLVELVNDFHATSVKVRVPRNGKLSRKVTLRVLRELCGMEYCSCGVFRGKQKIAVDSDYWGEVQFSKTDWRVDIALYVNGQIEYTGSYRYQQAFTAREAADLAYNDGEWIEGKEDTNFQTLIIARDPADNLESCWFYTFDKIYE